MIIVIAYGLLIVTMFLFIFTIVNKTQNFFSSIWFKVLPFLCGCWTLLAGLKLLLQAGVI